MNLYGYAGGDPINNSDPFGLCPPCGPEMAEVVRQLSQVSQDLKTALEVGTAVTLAPVVIVAAAEVGAAVGASQAVAQGSTAVARVAARAELEVAKSGAMSFAAGVVEGSGRAFVSDQGHKTLPPSGPPPNAAWGAGRKVGMALYYGVKIAAAAHGITW